MKRYKQLSYEERVKIATLWQSGSPIAEIGKALARSRTTIWRELKRNEAPPGQYWPDTAMRLTRVRRFRETLLERHKGLQEFVLEKLQCHFWTPEQIAGWLKHRQSELPYVCHETIYTWIYSRAQRKEKLWKFLPRHKSKRGLRKSKGSGGIRIKERVPIHERPEEASARKSFGHWEGDLMSCQKNSKNMLVLREKKSMFTLSVRLPNKRAPSVTTALIDHLKKIPPPARKTLTIDNGGEFADHLAWKKKLGLLSFFCDPYASWQKGGIENTNGRLRRDLPRKTNLFDLTEDDFNETILNYNTTPRKSLAWFTPLEVFKKNLSLVALQT